MSTLIRLALVISLFVPWTGCNSQKSNQDWPEKQTILNLIRKVSADNLVCTIKELENFETRYTWDKQNAVADYLMKKLNDYGIQAIFDEYVHNERIWRNVVVSFQGNKNPNKNYLVIAHYDSISDQEKNIAPGADDNGSGTAAAIEIARVLKDIRLNSTVKIAFFSNEEQGRLGSKHFTKKARSEHQDIQATINLDVIGYNDPIGTLEYDTDNERSLLNHVKRNMKMFRNYAFSLLYPNGRLTVAGRQQNKVLVHKTSEIFKEYIDLSVAAEIDENCG